MTATRVRRAALGTALALLALTIGVAGGVVAEDHAGIIERKSPSADRNGPGVESPPKENSTTTTVPATTTTMPPRAEPVRLAPTAAGPLLGTVIVVDPGHNGLNFKYGDVRRPATDGGEGPLCNTTGSSTNAGLAESTINWEIGTRLATLLRAVGAEVILTHTDLKGFGPCADERGRIARDADATALVSIHADGSARGSGFHIISPAPKDTLRPETVNASATLARAVRDELLAVGGRPANYVGSGGLIQRDDLANLNQADRPAILAELGNLRHPTDATMLSDQVAWMQIARALARSLVRFVGGVPDAPVLSGDLGGDGWPDYLPGAPQTTTTTVAVPETSAQPAGDDPATDTPATESSDPGANAVSTTTPPAAGP